MIDDLASTWGQQLQRAHADVSSLKRGLKHMNDRSGAGLAFCLSHSHTHSHTLTHTHTHKHTHTHTTHTHNTHDNITTITTTIGLAKCLSCSGPMPAPKPSLYWTRPGIDPVLATGSSGTYRLAHGQQLFKPPRTAAPPGVGSSHSPKRISTALPELTPRESGRENGSAGGRVVDGQQGLQGLQVYTNDAASHPPSPLPIPET